MANNFFLLLICWALFGFQHSFLSQKYLKDKLSFFSKDFVVYLYPFLYFTSQAIIYPAFYDVVINIKPTYVYYQFSDYLVYILLIIKYAGLLVLTIAVLSIDTNYFVGIKQIFFVIRSFFSNEKIIPKKSYSKAIIFNYVRHPMYLGIILVFIGDALVITDVFLFNFLFLILYVYIGVHYEERQLIRDFPDYLIYKNKVARINPLITLWKKYL